MQLSFNSQTYAQSSDGSNTTNFTTSASQSNTTAVTQQQLDDRMKEIVASDNPDDIATLAYIWGYPLVSVIRSSDFTTSPNLPPGPGRGPVNTFNHFKVFPDPNFTDFTRPNVDTLYSTAYVNLKNGPLEITVPPLADRFYSIQFADAYTLNYRTVGSRLNETTGGNYLLTGPEWKGTIPSGMKQIQSPTDASFVAIRILVKNAQDVSTVNAIQDKFIMTPLSAFENGESATNSTVSTLATGSNSTAPVSPKPEFIPTTGIKIYDEIGKGMADNPPPKNESAIVAKFKTIGIGPGLTPSTQANETIRHALEKGIVEGEKLIDARIPQVGLLVNGWGILGMKVNGSEINSYLGIYGSDYLSRAAQTKDGIFPQAAEEVIYPNTFVDSTNQTLNGANKYELHFDEPPPVSLFWSLTIYNDKSYLVDNPIDRYSIGDRTPGLVYNKDGSLDIYIQHDSPGPDKESNWLPAPTGDFDLSMRLYGPDDSILSGKYQYATIQKVTG